MTVRRLALESLRWLVVASLVPVVCVAAPLEAVGVPYAMNPAAWVVDRGMRFVGWISWKGGGR